MHVVEEARLLGSAHVDLARAAVHDHRERLTLGVTRTHLRSGAQVPEAHRLGARTEMESTAIEQAVDGADARLAGGRDRRER